jgi:divalent metal cation (Fe/Co/Zn/Cd) transporter
MKADHKSSPRARDLQAALRLEYATLAWMTLEFVSALALGLLSGSLLLLAFGLDSLIELASAAVMVWRLQVESRGNAAMERIVTVERRAELWTGYLLCALAAYVVASSAYGLAFGHGADTRVSIWGLIIGVIAVIAMPFLAYYKRKLARPGRLDSKALRADAAEAISCAYLAGVLIVGLLLSRLLGWWWLDSAAALALFPFIVFEAHEATSEKDEKGNNRTG